MREFINKYLGFRMTLEKIEENPNFIYGKDAVGRYKATVHGKEDYFEVSQIFKTENDAIDYINDMMNCKTKIETREYSYTWSKKPR